MLLRLEFCSRIKQARGDYRLKIDRVIHSIFAGLKALSETDRGGSSRLIAGINRLGDTSLVHIPTQCLYNDNH